MYADLHLHTTASDGNLSPPGLVIKAKDKGFTAIAVTDHDTTAGLNEAQKAGVLYGVEVIPGIELSALSEEREIHILGYYPDQSSSVLQGILDQMIDARQNRAFKMVEKLNKCGVGIALSRVREIAGAEFIGRPHIASALLEAGYIKNLKEAFSEEYIGRGGRAYVERFKLSSQEAISILLQCGATPVLAHPGFLSQGPPLAESEIMPLVKNGLQGIEVYCSRHEPEQECFYRQIAEKSGLLITGGSDCHGQAGTVNCLGSVKLPYSYVEALKNKRKQQ